MIPFWYIQNVTTSAKLKKQTMTTSKDKRLLANTDPFHNFLPFVP